MLLHDSGSRQNSMQHVLVADISVAVQTPGGLMVPIVHDADTLGLGDISATVKDLATRVSPSPAMTCSPLFFVFTIVTFTKYLHASQDFKQLPLCCAIIMR